jgi:cytochrome c
MARLSWLHISIAIIFALVALLFVRLHNANGAASDVTSAGHRLAEAWCKGCHSIEAAAAGAQSGPPDFTAIANRPSTTELSLKVFFQTSHRSMPNLVIAPDQADALANYILSLRRN